MSTSIYRRCGCRDDAGRMYYGEKCPKMASDPEHGKWSFGVGAGVDRAGKRRQIRRGGFSTREEATRARDEVIRALGVEKTSRSVATAALIRNDPKPEVVYYVERDGYVKIGYTNNIAFRLKTFEGGVVLPPGMKPNYRLLATEPGGLQVESARHQMFAGERVGGEWFLLSERLRRHIDSLEPAGDFRVAAQSVADLITPHRS